MKGKASRVGPMTPGWLGRSRMTQLETGAGTFRVALHDGLAAGSRNVKASFSALRLLDPSRGLTAGQAALSRWCIQLSQFAPWHRLPVGQPRSDRLLHFDYLLRLNQAASGSVKKARAIGRIQDSDAAHSPHEVEPGELEVAAYGGLEPGERESIASREFVPGDAESTALKISGPGDERNASIETREHAPSDIEFTAPHIFKPGQKVERATGSRELVPGDVESAAPRAFEPGDSGEVLPRAGESSESEPASGPQPGHLEVTPGLSSTSALTHRGQGKTPARFTRTTARQAVQDAQSLTTIRPQMAIRPALMRSVRLPTPRAWVSALGVHVGDLARAPVSRHLLQFLNAGSKDAEGANRVGDSVPIPEQIYPDEKAGSGPSGIPDRLNRSERPARFEPLQYRVIRALLARPTPSFEPPASSSRLAAATVEPKGRERAVELSVQDQTGAATGEDTSLSTAASLQRDQVPLPAVEPAAQPSATESPGRGRSGTAFLLERQNAFTGRHGLETHDAGSPARQVSGRLATFVWRTYLGQAGRLAGELTSRPGLGPSRVMSEPAHRDFEARHAINSTLWQVASRSLVPTLARIARHLVPPAQTLTSGLKRGSQVETRRAETLDRPMAMVDTRRETPAVRVMHAGASLLRRSDTARDQALTQPSLDSAPGRGISAGARTANGEMVTAPAVSGAPVRAIVSESDRAEATIGHERALPNSSIWKNVDRADTHVRQMWPVLGLIPQLALPRAVSDEPAALQILRRMSPVQARSAAASLAALATLGAGEPLAESVRKPMQVLLGRDLSEVRVHTSTLATELGAEAFTTGRQIVAAPGRMDLRTSRGLALLGHELAHIGQPLAFKRTVGSGAEADDSEERVARQQELRVQRMMEQGWPAGPRMDLRRAGGPSLLPQESGVSSSESQPELPAGRSGLDREQATVPEWATIQASTGSDSGTPVVQRSEAAPAETSPAEPPKLATGSQSKSNLDELAQQVYGILKNRLRAERERHQIYSPW